MNILMPQLGETVAEGKITKWFKSAGDTVKPGDNLFEIETDKTSMEVPATEAGILREIRVLEGEVAPVGAIVGVIGDVADATVSAPPGPAPATPASRAAIPPAEDRAAAPPKAPQQPIKLDPFFEVRTPDRNFGSARLPGGVTVTPLARRLAAEAGIDLKRSARLRSARPHRRERCRERAAGSARLDSRRTHGRRDQGALRPGKLRGSDARRHAAHHRGAASAGQAVHPAFLSDRRYRDRPPQGAARGGE